MPAVFDGADQPMHALDVYLVGYNDDKVAR